MKRDEGEGPRGGFPEGLYRDPLARRRTTGEQAGLDEIGPLEGPREGEGPSMKRDKGYGEKGSVLDTANKATRALIRKNRAKFMQEYRLLENWAGGGFTNGGQYEQDRFDPFGAGLEGEDEG